jgi:hypothetical protein
MLRRTPPDQVPHEEEHGTVRDGDGSTRKFTVVGWRPGQRKAPPATDTPISTRDRVAAVALWVAGIVIVGVIIGGAVVVYDAQFKFAFDHNGGNKDVAHIQAAIPDLVWVAMSALGLAQALRGRSSLRATSSIFVFFGLSMGAQLLHAEQTPEGYLVAAITPLALALMLEALLHGVRHWALARDGQDTPTTPLLVRVFVGLLRALVLPLAWLLRLLLDPKRTAGGMRDWLLDVTPYAPGRTLAQDKALQALEQAGSAEEIAERVKVESAKEIAAVRAAEEKRTEEARARAEQQVQEIKEQAARQIKEATDRLTSRADEAVAAEVQRREELESEHQAARAALEKEIQGLRTKLEQELAQARQQQESALSEQRQRHDRELVDMRARLERNQRALNEARDDVERYSEELRTMMGSLSGRNQVTYLYDRMRREGDHRHGRPEYVSEIADELIRQGVSVESTATVARYLREALAESGRESDGVAPVGAGSIGGGL